MGIPKSDAEKPKPLPSASHPLPARSAGGEWEGHGREEDWALGLREMGAGW